MSKLSAWQLVISRHCKRGIITVSYWPIIACYFPALLLTAGYSEIWRAALEQQCYSRCSNLQTVTSWPAKELVIFPGPLTDGLAADPWHGLLLGGPPPPRRFLRGQQNLLVGGADPLPVVRSLRPLHEVQRGGRGHVSLLLSLSQGQGEKVFVAVVVTAVVVFFSLSHLCGCYLFNLRCPFSLLSLLLVVVISSFSLSI